MPCMWTPPTVEHPYVYYRNLCLVDCYHRHLSKCDCSYVAFGGSKSAIALHNARATNMQVKGHSSEKRSIVYGRG